MGSNQRRRKLEEIKEMLSCYINGQFQTALLYNDGQRLSRHSYDVFRLLASEQGDAAIKDLELADRCAKHARLYFDRKPLDLDQAVPGTFGIVPADGMLGQLKADYNKMAGMIFGDVPSFEDILGKIKMAEATLNAA